MWKSPTGDSLSANGEGIAREGELRGGHANTDHMWGLPNLLLLPYLRGLSAEQPSSLYSPTLGRVNLKVAP
mgnify:CR=1 FL=1